MSSSRRSASPRVNAEALQTLQINAAERAAAEAEFERAERAADALTSIVERCRHALSLLQRTFTVRRQRHG